MHGIPPAILAHRRRYYSREAFAAISGLGASTVARIEAWEGDIKVGTLSKYLAALNCKFDIRVRLTGLDADEGLHGEDRGREPWSE